MAATALAPNFTLQPRSSTETDRRHLLSDSIAPSAATSVIDLSDGEQTPRAHSPANSSRTAHGANVGQDSRRGTIADPSTQQRPYRGFPSEAAYLAALHDWAESKKYIQTGEGALYGFYGDTTMEEYAARPKIELGLKKKWKARKEAKQEARMSRRNTVT